MALSDNRGGREFNKFVADGSGDASIRVTSTSSVTTSATVETGAGGAAVGTGIATGTTETQVLAATDVEGKSRIGIQIYNTGNSVHKNAVYVVYASLRASPGTVGATDWTQIGDNINIAQATNAYKAISTTPIKWIAITGHSRGSDFADAATPVATTTNIYLMAD
tara:strand:- start:112 stop:606 length:495 start_codon:yes stop_codon:yes gene_type:complete